MTKKQPENYLIDFCQRGNAIRLYFGTPLELVKGCDWDDCPYESNAGLVYSEYINFYMDVLIPFRWKVTDIAQELDMYTNSKYCRNDFKKGEIPIFWIIDHNYEYKNIYFYMGNNKKEVMKKLNIINAIIQIIKVNNYKIE